jgi:hypothetical protein
MNLHCEKKKYIHTFTVWQNSDVNSITEGGTYNYHRAINDKRRNYRTAHLDCSANDHTVRFRANLNVILKTESRFVL